jgi:hypothetical protein
VSDEFDDDEEQRPDIPKPALSHEEFLRWRSPRFGERNPTDLTNPLWVWLVQMRQSAYRANEAWNGPSPFSAGPMWCFDRFGQSVTQLPDGRKVYIAGEHEDYYDPDFCIYNDVVVESPDGAISIFGYPQETFPPTDFHSATLVGDRIIIVGNLGYEHERSPGHTEVYELSIETWAIKRLETQGPAPGWISRHTASFLEDTGRIRIYGGQVIDEGEPYLWENTDEWTFDPASCAWHLTERRPWRQWTLMHGDRSPNRLWQMRHALWMQKVGWKSDLAEQMEGFEKELGFRPELNLLESLYRYGPEVTPLPNTDEDSRWLRFESKGQVVRFQEDTFSVHIVAEGAISDEDADRLTTGVTSQLSGIDRAVWTAVERAR